jgi:F-box protein 11
VPPTASPPKTLLVDAHGSGTYRTVGEAIAAAQPGDRILIRPGVYHEAVRIAKPVELVGDGKREDVVLDWDGPEPWSLQLDAQFARLERLTVRRRGKSNQIALPDGGAPGYPPAPAAPATYPPPPGVYAPPQAVPYAPACAIFVALGKLDTADCLFSSDGGSGVVVAARADLHGCRIYDCAGWGIEVAAGGQLTATGSELLANRAGGISLLTGARATLRGNRIVWNKGPAIHAERDATGSFEDNDLRDNAGGAWQLPYEKGMLTGKLKLLANITHQRNLE